MSRPVALFLTVLGAKFATAAASSAECQGKECQDETSLVQVKASIKRHTDDEDDGPSGSRDVSLFFKNKEDLIAGLREASDCLKEGSFSDHGKYPQCADSTEDPQKKGGICIKCIHAQWATKNSGAGFDCCKAMSKDQIKKAPLCGVCLRSKKGGLQGPSGTANGDADQSQFTKCAKYYCEAGPSSTVSTNSLKDIAHWCSPAETKNNGPGPVQNMIGIVANDPKKNSLQGFLDTEKGDIKSLTASHNITGTKSSSDMAQCVTKGKKAAFHTFSGPWGGDAQLAGLLALQKTDAKHKYIDALIFFNEEQEAHKEDILSLVAVMHATMDKSKVAFTPSVAKTLITKLKSR